MTTDTDDLKSLDNDELNRVAAEAAIENDIILDFYSVGLGDGKSVRVTRKRDSQYLYYRPATDARHALELLEGVVGNRWESRPPSAFDGGYVVFPMVNPVPKPDGSIEAVFGHARTFSTAATIAAIKAWRAIKVWRAMEDD